MLMQIWKNGKKLNKEIKDAGYNLEIITSFEWIKTPESKQQYRFKNQEQEEEEELSKEVKRDRLLDDIRRDEIFGFVQCNMNVPEHSIEQFSDYPPIFENTEINIKDIGETIQAYWESIARKTV